MTGNFPKALDGVAKSNSASAESSSNVGLKCAILMSVLENEMLLLISRKNLIHALSTQPFRNLTVDYE